MVFGVELDLEVRVNGADNHLQETNETRMSRMTACDEKLMGSSCRRRRKGCKQRARGGGDKRDTTRRKG